MTEHAFEKIKLNPNLAFAFSFIIYHSAFRVQQDAENESMKLLLEALLLCFNRESEDVSLIPKPKVDRGIPRTKKAIQEIQRLNKIPNHAASKETQDKIDSNVLWALLTFCQYSEEHAKVFLQVLDCRRLEFTRKCARLLSNYSTMAQMPQSKTKQK